MASRQENSIVMSEHPDYAMIYLYRDAGDGGYLVQYNVNLNEDFVYRCSPQSCAEVRVETPGEYLLSAKTEAGDSYPLNVELGREYYVRCSVSMGIVVGRPVFELIEGQNGRLEYAAVKEKQKASTEPSASSSESQEEITSPHWQVSMQGGFAFRTASVSKDLDIDTRDHLKKLKRGLGYSVSAAYYFNSNWGIGASFDAYRAVANYKGQFDEVTNIHFAGPVVAMRYFSPSGRHIFYCMEGIGYLGYSDAVSSTPYKTRSGVPGLLSKLGYDYALTDNIAIGVSITGVNGTVTWYTATDGKNKRKTKLDAEDYEDLGNIRISAGLSFYF